MWNVIERSVRGTAHERDGSPCQDSSYTLRTIADGEWFLIAACADGAGSAQLSELGSTLACQEAVRLAEAALQAGHRPETMEAAMVSGWLGEIRRAIASRAGELGVASRDLACTLLLAIVGEQGAAYAQVGDGAVVVQGISGLETVFWPETTEYLNLTQFITDPSSPLQFTTGPAPDRLALLTDGLQLLALDYARRVPHEGLFQPLFASLESSSEPESLYAPLGRFLDSPAVNARTDDDKTLVLATRHSHASAAA